MPPPPPNRRSDLRWIEHRSGARSDGDHLDQVIGGLAAGQHGVVSREELLAAGVGRRALARRLASGHLLTLHHGVYAVGHDRLTDDGRWLAAVLALGPGAVLSHRSAAALHGLRPDSRRAIDVTTPTQRVSRAGIVVHARRQLVGADRTIVGGIRATTVARTLVDLAEVVPADHLAAAMRRADRNRTFDLRAIESALARTRGRTGRGHAVMRVALARARARAGQLTRSGLEERFLDLVAQAGLPQPRTNVWMPEHDFEVDALWPVERIAVELDSWREHGTRDAFQRDRRKANALTVEGWRVLRFTYYDVTGRPTMVASQLRAAFTERGALGRAP